MPKRIPDQGQEEYYLSIGILKPLHVAHVYLSPFEYLKKTTTA